ncbi:hypothetical protein ACFE04_030090 [Oxalis oulophora]
MDDFPGILARDFGFKPQGKSAPMSATPRSSSSSGFDNNNINNNLNRSSSSSTSSSSKPVYDDHNHDHLFNDVFGGPPKYSSQQPSSASSSHQFDYDSIFKDTNTTTTTPKSTTTPVYDKPVYDDDIFEGLPGMKTSSSSSPRGAAKFENVFASMNNNNNKAKTTTTTTSSSSPFDDLLGNLGTKESESRTERVNNKSEKDSPVFDDLLAGFGANTTSNRSTSESSRFQNPSSNSTKTASNVMEDPFGVFESTSSPPVSSTGMFMDPLEEISKLSKPGVVKMDNSSVGSGVFDDIDPLGSLGKSARSTSSDGNERGKDRNPLKTGTKSSSTSQESVDNDSHLQKRMPVPDFQESHQTIFDSTDFHGSVGQNMSPPSHLNPTHETNSQANSTRRAEEVFESRDDDDVWLSVSEIPLFTQPTSAPPPARPPPPRPTRYSRTDTGRKNVNEFSSKYSDSPKSTPTAARSSIDELEDFAQGRANNNVSEHPEVLSGDDMDSNSVAAAAMKEAMYRAEAKFRHAKEMRERDNIKTARSKDENFQEPRQAVERATREARERAAIEARSRAERVAVEKASGEARVRAERAAVQRAQAEARERAAVDARERAERAAAEARERANVEARDRARAERAAAERAAAEARERAAAAARANQQKNDNDLESFFNMGRASSAPRPRANSSDPAVDPLNRGAPDGTRKSTSGSSSNIKRASSTTNMVDDLSSIFGAPVSNSGDFQEVDGETEERRRARLERHQRTQERAAKALAEKNNRDLQAQREQAERHRIAETLDVEIKRWAAGKEGNLRALLSTLQYYSEFLGLDIDVLYNLSFIKLEEWSELTLLFQFHVLWPECGWQPVSLTDLITGAHVKKVYRKATLCIHPDKVQQKGANLQQKYVAEKVFDLLKCLIEEMLENPTVTPVDSAPVIKRYAPPNQRNRSLSRRKSTGLDRIEGDKYGPAVAASSRNDNARPRQQQQRSLIGLEGCSLSEASHLLNDRWSATIHLYNEMPANSAERPVMYSGSSASAWAPFQLPHQMIPPPNSVSSPGLQSDFLSELRRAMRSA